MKIYVGSLGVRMRHGYWYITRDGRLVGPVQQTFGPYAYEAYEAPHASEQWVFRLGKHSDFISDNAFPDFKPCQSDPIHEIPFLDEWEITGDYRKPKFDYVSGIVEPHLMAARSPADGFVAMDAKAWSDDKYLGKRVIVRSLARADDRWGMI